MALSMEEEKEAFAQDPLLSDRLRLRRGELAREASDTNQDAEMREPEEIFEAIFPETHEDEGVTGSD